MAYRKGRYSRNSTEVAGLSILDPACGSPEAAGRGRPCSIPHHVVQSAVRPVPPRSQRQASQSRKVSANEGSIYVMKDLRKIYPPEPGGPEGNLAVVLPRRQDRRAGPQRRRQEHAAADHGRRDKEFGGEAWAGQGRPRSATCPRSRGSTPAKDVLGNVEEGVAETRALLDRFDEINAKFGEPMSDDEMDKLIAEQARVQDAIEAANAWELDRTLEIAMDALRLPPPDADVEQALRRRAPPRRALPAAPPARPTSCCSTSPPTTSTPSRSPGSSATWPNTRARWSPSPTTATSSTTSPAGSWSSTAARASPGRATTPPGWSRSRSGWRSEEKHGVGAPAHAAARARVGAHGARAPARPRARPASTPTSSCSPRTARPRSATIRTRSTSPPGPASATWWSRPRASARATATTC